MKYYRSILCFLLLGIFPGEHIVFGQETEPAKVSISEDDYVHFGDVIDVDVVGGFEFDWRGTLTPEGYLDGVDGFSEPVFGLCRTEAQIAADVARVFGKILREPKVMVKIIDRSNRAVARIEGAVRTPSRFRLQRSVSLNELLVLAGGLTDAASGEITIFRLKNLGCRPSLISVSKPQDKPLGPQDNASQAITIKISDLISGKLAANPRIVSGDMITVIRAMPVYVIGAVNNPRPIYSRDRNTVSRAIASAGGLAKDSDGGKISIVRRYGTETRIIHVDLAKIRLGETEDEILRAFDIIDVVAKRGGKRKYPPVAQAEENRGQTKPELPLKIVD